MSKVMWVCPRCGTSNLENKCKNCGYEVLPKTPKPIMKKKEKERIEGVYY